MDEMLVICTTDVLAIRTIEVLVICTTEMLVIIIFMAQMLVISTDDV